MEGIGGGQRRVAMATAAQLAFFFFHLVGRAVLPSPVVVEAGRPVRIRWPPPFATKRADEGPIDGGHPTLDGTPPPQGRGLTIEAPTAWPSDHGDWLQKWIPNFDPQKDGLTEKEMKMLQEEREFRKTHFDFIAGMGIPAIAVTAVSVPSIIAQLGFSSGCVRPENVPLWLGVQLIAAGFMAYAGYLIHKWHGHRKKLADAVQQRLARSNKIARAMQRAAQFAAERDNNGGAAAAAPTA